LEQHYLEHNQHQMFDAIESTGILQPVQYRSYLLLTIDDKRIFFINLYDIEYDLFEQNQMEIEYQLYHLSVHSILASNIESFLKMYKYVYRDYNRHLLRLQEQIKNVYMIY
jgi:hypothetical protein